MAINAHLVQATSCTIGSTTFTEIQYHAPRPVGSGPSGAVVSPRFVANTVLPVGVTPHNLSYEVEICVDADYASIFALASVTAPGTLLAPCTVTEKAADGKTRLITYNQAYFQSCDPIKIEAKAEHQYFAIHVLCLAAPTIATWA